MRVGVLEALGSAFSAARKAYREARSGDDRDSRDTSRSRGEQAILRGLHPELAKRIEAVARDLKDRGWHPQLTEGFRSRDDQARLKQGGKTTVDFGFHNVTGPGGKPSSMAVHVWDRDLGKQTPGNKGHPFWADLEAVALRQGLRTGRGWSKPKEDVAHVQLYDNRRLGEVEGWVNGGSTGPLPPFLSPREVPWTSGGPPLGDLLDSLGETARRIGEALDDAMTAAGESKADRDKATEAMRDALGANEGVLRELSRLGGEGRHGELRDGMQRAMDAARAASQAMHGALPNPIPSGIPSASDNLQNALDRARDLANGQHKWLTGSVTGGPPTVTPREPWRTGSVTGGPPTVTPRERGRP